MRKRGSVVTWTGLGITLALKVQPVSSIPSLAQGEPLNRLARILFLGQTLGSGASRLVLRSPVADGAGGAHPHKDATEIEPTIRALFALLRDRGVRYLLVGGIALLRYVPGRNTEDIDLLLGVDALERLPEIQIGDRNDWFATGGFQGLRVDFLLTSNPLFRIVLDRYATRHRFVECEVPCATAEGLILLKLYALPSLYRQGDIQRANLYEADVAALLFAAQPEVARLLTELAPHVSASDSRELSRIIEEAKARAHRFSDPEARPG